MQVGGTAAVTVALLTACGPGTAESAGSAPTAAGRSSSAPTVRLDAATRGRLQAVFEDTFTTVVGGTRSPGASVFVSVGPDVWTSQLGGSDTATGTRVPSDGRWRIASVTKPFVFEAVLRLVDEGRLSLDDHLERFVPGIANGTTITVRQLLRMSASVSNFTADQDLVARFDANPTLRWSVDQTVALIRTHLADFAPEE